MTPGTASPAYPVGEPTVVIEPGSGLFHLNLRDLWQSRELLYFLVWRDVKVRYKQTAIGVAWVILQPLLTMMIFTVVFGIFVNVPSEGVPYPLFAYTALLPWLYFSSALNRSANSLIGEADLLQKVYFPRLILPISAVVAPAVDFAIGFVILLAMLVWYGIAPTWTVLALPLVALLAVVAPAVDFAIGFVILLAMLVWYGTAPWGALALPLFALLAVTTSLSVGLWLSALNVRYRDVGHTIPFLTQFWMYATPVAYPMSLVPEKWRVLFSLNPMAGVIEGFRWGILGQDAPDFGLTAVSTAIVLALLAGGLVFFKQMERTFADIV